MTEMGLNIGMLWFDNNPKKDWSGVIREASEFYAKKYGKVATLCVVHPSCFEAPAMSLGDMQIIKSKTILTNHYWIGTSSTKTEVISDKDGQNG